MNGGYKMIDFRDINLTSVAVKIDGIYESIESNHRKALMLGGLNFENIEKANVYCQPVLTGTTYTFTCYGKTITITDSDMCSIN